MYTTRCDHIVLSLAVGHVTTNFVLSVIAILDGQLLIHGNHFVCKGARNGESTALAATASTRAKEP